MRASDSGWRKLMPFYEYSEDHFFCSDDAPPDVARMRRHGFERLSHQLWNRAADTIRLSEELEPLLSDLQFVNRYRVPFQYAGYVRTHLKLGSLLERSSGVQVEDLDGRLAYDLTGSYGNQRLRIRLLQGLHRRRHPRVRNLGPVLGATTRWWRTTSGN